MYLGVYGAGGGDSLEKLCYSFILDVKVILQAGGWIHELGISIAELLNNAWLPDAKYHVTIIITFEKYEHAISAVCSDPLPVPNILARLLGPLMENTITLT